MKIKQKDVEICLVKNIFDTAESFKQILNHNDKILLILLILSMVKSICGS